MLTKHSIHQYSFEYLLERVFIWIFERILILPNIHKTFAKTDQKLSHKKKNLSHKTNTNKHKRIQVHSVTTMESNYESVIGISLAHSHISGN